jgi:hypothetical protein
MKTLLALAVTIAVASAAYNYEIYDNFGSNNYYEVDLDLWIDFGARTQYYAGP